MAEQLVGVASAAVLKKVIGGATGIPTTAT
jgi:hypothetical protein